MSLSTGAATRRSHRSLACRGVAASAPRRMLAVTAFRASRCGSWRRKATRSTTPAAIASAVPISRPQATNSADVPAKVAARKASLSKQTGRVQHAAGLTQSARALNTDLRRSGVFVKSANFASAAALWWASNMSFRPRGPIRRRRILPMQTRACHLEGKRAVFAAIACLIARRTAATWKLLVAGSRSTGALTAI